MRRIVQLWLLLVVALGTPESAEASDRSPYEGRGASERAAIERGLEALDLEPDHAPWGAEVCSVRVWSEPVVREPDFLPVWLNVFHRTTRERIVRRVNTIRAGDRFTLRAYEESERALRDPYVFAVVAVVTTRSDTPGCTDVLLVTRDAWSLNLSWLIETNGATLSTLYLGVTESNLFGTGDALSVGFTRTVGSWEMGPSYVSQHIGGSRVAVSEAFRVFVDRETGALDGTANTFQIARPIYQTGVRWGWSASAAHDFSLRRRYTGTQLDTYDVGGEAVPERYRSRSASGAAEVTRAWGDDVRWTLSPGFRVSWRDAEPEPRDADVSAAALAVYAEERLPRSELAVGPTLRARTYRNRYFRLVDYESYGVSEELRAGHSIEVALAWSEPTFGSDQRYLSVSTNLSWREPLGDDAFLSASVSHDVRVDDGVSDLSVSGGLRLVTPQVFAGRIVAAVGATELRRNGANTLLSIGGGTGLRGYADGALKGTRGMQANVEWRSKPWRIARVSLGGVVFYDVGAVWEPFDPVVYHPSAGFGLRLVVPAIGTAVRVADLAFPLRGYAGPVLSVGVEQAF